MWVVNYTSSNKWETINLNKTSLFDHTMLYKSRNYNVLIIVLNILQTIGDWLSLIKFISNINVTTTSSSI